MTSGLLVGIALSALVLALLRERSLARFLYFLAFLAFLSLDPESGGLQALSGLGGQNVLIKLSVRLATSAALLLLLVRRRGAVQVAFLPPCWPIVFFVSWALVGLMQVRTPWVAVFRLGELVAFFLIGVCLYAEHDRAERPRAVARVHCLALLPLCLTTLYMARVNPELAYHDGIAGIRLGHKLVEANVLGFAGCVLMLWATHELREKRELVRGWIFERALPLAVLAIAAVVLYYARSRTAMITAVAGQFLLWFPFSKGDSRRRTLFVLFVLLCLGFVAAESDTILRWFLRGDTLATLTNGTGRTELWKALILEQVPKAPLFGTGYLSLSEDGYFLHDGTWWTNAHNTYMFSLVSTGIPGLLAVLLIAFLPLRTTLRRVFSARPEDRPSWVLLFSLQAVVAITSITGFGIIGFPNAVMLFHYALYLYCVGPVRSEPAIVHRLARPRAGVGIGRRARGGAPDSGRSVRGERDRLDEAGGPSIA